MSPIKKIWLPTTINSRSVSQRSGSNMNVQFYSKGKWTPDTDIYETDEGLMIIIDIAGVKKEEIQVILEGQVLTISGVRQEPAVTKKYIHRLEIDFGHFERSFRIPLDIHIDKIEARYEEGFLYVWLPQLRDTECAIDITIL